METSGGTWSLILICVREQESHVVYPVESCMEPYEVSVEKFEDSRGFFARVFNHPEAFAHGFGPQIVQVNNSFNKEKGYIERVALSGTSSSESKIVRALQGALWDVILDYVKSLQRSVNGMSVTLTAEKRNMVLVPAGCAHGILTLRREYRDALFCV